MPSTDTPRDTQRLTWLAGLAARGAAPAVVTRDSAWTYDDLAREVEDAADQLAGPRRLVLVEGTNTLPSLVGYLAAHAAGHAVLMAPGGNDAAVASLRAAYDPDVVVGADGAVTQLRTDHSAHVLHPDLALLMSTSGSTGSPKLVRLSWDNLQANAESIAGYLGIRPTDRAATTLPLHYCYGLSVLHSHLLVGASLLLTDLSVVDECFWEAFRAGGATTFAAVPYTFDLLDRVGFADLDLPRLRYVTQAGGRLEPDRVRNWAEVGRSNGWDLFVMYGQTEATARMAYLPPDLAFEHPEAVGVAIPGGELAIEDGELVYSGRNVMLGYADDPDDLGLGRTVERLRTGDLARRTDDGLFVVTGRRSRFVKVLGHRVDLDAVERRLRESGHDARCVGVDGAVTIAVTPGRRQLTSADTPLVACAAARAAGIPQRAVRVHLLDALPVLASGKPDYAALTRLTLTEPDGAEAGSVTELYAELLNRADVTPDSTFASLGGDSLTYVEVSLRLEELHGSLPASWHTRSVGELQAAVTARATEPGGDATGRRRWREVETSVWLRAVAILLIVGTHAHVFVLQGTAHALLMLAGFNLARFQLTDTPRTARLRHLTSSLGRVVAPTVVVVGLAHLLLGQYTPANTVLLNWAFGEARLGPPWRFWFVEALVLALVLTIALLAVPWVDRLERRRPFAVPAVLLSLSLLTRFDVVPLPVPRMQGSALVVLWLFFLGWAAGKAASVRQRLVVSAFAVATIGSFSGNPRRDLLTLTVIGLVIWVPTVRLPRIVVPVAQVLASASLYIYVIHWQVTPALRDLPWLAYAVGVALGIAYWWAWTQLSPRVVGLLSRARPQPRAIRAPRPPAPAPVL